MSWRGTIILFVVLVGLAGAYYALQQREVEKAQRIEAAKRLFDWDASAVSRLKLQQIEAAAVVGERVGEGWKIVEPNPSIPAFVPLWNRVAEQLAGLMNERSIEPTSGLNLADYGLDIPVLQVEASVNGEEVSLRFGALEPTQERRYALLGEASLFLVHKNAFFELNRSLEDLWNKFTVDDREANILRLEFAQIWTGEGDSAMENPPAVGEESPPIIAAREAVDKPWKLIAPRQAAANQEIINAIVQELQFAVGRKFIDNVESLADYGMQPARLRITMVDDREGRAQTFLFGGFEPESNGLYVRRPDRDGVFVLDPQIVTLLPRSPDEFQERRLVTQQAAETERIEIVHRGEQTVIRNDEERGWVVESEVPFDTDQAAVSTYITALKRAAGERIILAEPAEVGLAEPETTVSMYPKGGGAPSMVRLQSQWEEDGFMVAQQDLGAIMTLPVSQGELLQVDRMHFRSRKLWSFVPAEIMEVALRFEDKDYQFKRAHGTWAALAPDNLRLPDGSALDAWLERVSELRVISPRPESGMDAAAAGLDAPLLDAVFTGESTSLGPLRVGAATPEKMLQRYIAVEGQEGIYRVDQKFIDATREFLSTLAPK
ncbi:MAG: hypothetical protein RLZZ303_1042 [Candidatus Hydrogenedentota bacterium]